MCDRFSRREMELAQEEETRDRFVRIEPESGATVVWSSVDGDRFAEKETKWGFMDCE